MDNRPITERITLEEFGRRVLEERSGEDSEAIARRRREAHYRSNPAWMASRTITEKITTGLVEYLAGFGWSVRTEVTVKPGHGCIKESRRIDILAEMPCGDGKPPLTCSFEVKSYREDFQKEKRTPGKSLAARQLTDLYYFVAPERAVKLKDIPDWAGFIRWDVDGTFQILKEAPRKRLGGEA